MHEIICLGKKDKFQLKLQEVDDTRNYAYMQLLINSYELGEWENPVYIWTMHQSLIHVKDLSKSVVVKKFLNNVPAQSTTFDRFSNMLLGDKMLLGYQENFDMYHFRIFQYNQDVHFFWKMYEHSFFVTDIKPGLLYHETVSLENYYQVTEELEKIYSDMWLNWERF